MITLHDRLGHLFERMEYKENTGFLRPMKNELQFIQHWQQIPCTTTGEVSIQRGRKFYISEHMTDGEIIRTCRLAILSFEEHEVNELFKLDGDRVLNPHPEGPRP